MTELIELVHFDEHEPLNYHLNERKVPSLNHSPHSPDLAPCDFWLFSTLHLRGRQLRTHQDVVMATTMFFNRLEEAEFHETIEQKSSERMENYIRNDGRYFEKEARQNYNSDAE